MTDRAVTRCSTQRPGIELELFVAGWVPVEQTSFDDAVRLALEDD